MDIKKLSLKFTWRSRKTQNSQHSIKGEEKLEDLYYPTSKLNIKPQYSRQCGIGKRTDKKINETK